ncbi:hypothetical protein [Acinetobacter sp. HY1485]|uniref:hypothetical protein n=1 Tax=Acinetobacter sp. HY1485 TaxID=2970918 RepID=UPI0022B95246|nr:hypothetical protein [Acinetobacter sp. HY1485]
MSSSIVFATPTIENQPLNSGTDNPSVFRVVSTTTGQALVRVGDATQRGVDRVQQSWKNSKPERTALKQKMVGTPNTQPTPIEQNQLSN